MGLKKYTLVLICLVIAASYIVSNVESKPQKTRVTSPGTKKPTKPSKIVNSTTDSNNTSSGINSTESGNSNGCNRQDIEPRAGKPQYIIGYGSLMQNESKLRTAPLTGPSIPVQVKGYRREWNSRGPSVGLSATFLGVVKNASSSFSAVIFELVELSQRKTSAFINETLKALDEREGNYCRERVPNKDVKLLVTNQRKKILQFIDDDKTDYWVYVNKPEFTAYPNPNFPIVQSYVDIFISGCIEHEEDFKISNFVDDCIKSTFEWSKHWVNDRIYPRRPFIYQKKANQIDTALKKHLPKYFNQIKIQ